MRDTDNAMAEAADECGCGHSRELHDDSGCMGSLTYGVPCRCREFQATEAE